MVNTIMFISLTELKEYLEESLIVEYVKHIPNHKNSKGEGAPWCVISHETGKIISSHKTKGEAEKHLQQMHIFK